MGTSTEELNSDIARTRAELSQDVDALQDKVSPSAIMERRKTAVRDRWSSAKDKVMGSGQSASQGASRASAAPRRAPALPSRTASRAAPSPPAWWLSAPGSSSPA